MTDVTAIIAVELFQAHLTGIACREFDQIMLDYAEDLWSTIEAEFNAHTCTWGPTEKSNSELSDVDMAQLSQ